jgi:hypothetical protein
MLETLRRILQGIRVNRPEVFKFFMAWAILHEMQNGKGHHIGYKEVPVHTSPNTHVLGKCVQYEAVQAGLRISDESERGMPHLSGREFVVYSSGLKHRIAPCRRRRFLELCIMPCLPVTLLL